MNEDIKFKVLEFFYDNDLIPDLDPAEYTDAQVLKLLKTLKDGLQLKDAQGNLLIDLV